MTKVEMVQRIRQRGPVALDAPVSVGDVIEMMDMVGMFKQDNSRAVCPSCRKVVHWPDGFANHSGAGTTYVCAHCAGVPS